LFCSTELPDGGRDTPFALLRGNNSGSKYL
jgi:hypothetical protein